MPLQSWSTFEHRVRGIASQIWSKPAEPEQIAGVAVDCVVHINADLCYLIEITEERNLEKVRGDVIKLLTARNHLLATEHKYAICYCVIDADTITKEWSMRAKAKKSK